MNKTRFKYLFLILIILFPASLGAVDLGLLLNQYVGLNSAEPDNTHFEYRAGLIPRLSLLIGDTGSFFTSASLNIGYSTDSKFYFVPELLRTEFSMRFGAFGISAGRIGYSEPLTFIAQGLFDGVRLTHSSSIGRIGFGAWYTGFLYKKNAEIAMTKNDQILLESDLDFGNFAKTYFAPNRMVMALDWEHPSVADFLLLKATVMGQIDFACSEKYHSEYIILKAGLPLKNFMIEAGGSIEIIQDDSDNNLALAGELGCTYFLPTSFMSRLSFAGRFASGASEKTLGAFVPINSKSYGNVFDSKMSGLTLLSLDYSARILDSLGASITASYFIRNGCTEFFNYSGASLDKRLLGGEFFGKIVWSIFSDLQLTLGGGTFIPAMGNYWPDLKTQWCVNLTAVLGIY